MKRKQMNKKVVVTLTVVASICYFGSNLNVKMTLYQAAVIEMQNKPAQVNAPVIMNENKEAPAPVLPAPSRGPGSNALSLMDQRADLNFTKHKVVRQFSGKDDPALPPGFQLADSIFAVKKSEFSHTLGDIVEEKNGYVFFQAEQRPANVGNVVIDQKNHQLYTISSVIKLENVDEHLRNSLLTKGLEEHYYHEDLKVLYVQSNQDEIFNLHSELRAGTLQPKVEIIRAHHRPK